MSEEKPKRGRPVVEGKRRGKAVFVRMTDAEMLKLAALAAGVPLATYLRQRGLDAKGAEMPKEEQGT